MALFETKPKTNTPKPGGLFAPKPKPESSEAISYLSNQINNMGRRLRIMEERFSNIRNKMEVDERNMLMFHKKVNTEFKTFNSEITDIKSELKDIRQQMSMMIKEIQLSAKKEDVKVLEKYIDIWQPLNFATRKEVEKIVRELLEEENKKFINV
ncbi:MAG: hypothetical protein U9R08_01240 [Nanoarchaeota archaeon]|nr:hypothetical protein [Nanoarchaeota archaeon]